MTTTAFVPRAVCARCRRPVAVCVCGHLPDLAPRTRVVILQHPRERRMPIGTARLAARCLRGSTVLVGTRFEDHPEVSSALTDPQRRPILLWPGPGACDLSVAPPPGPVTLFVVDGTWTTAAKLVKENPAIAALPRFALPARGPSEYRIRREPRAECLSTIEAIAEALGLLEGDGVAYRAMMAPFRAMVEAQLGYVERGGSPRDRSRLRARVRRPWAAPSALRDPARVVVVAAEANAWPLGAKDAHPDEIVHWLAVRGDAGERLERIVRPSHPLAPSVTAHTGLPPEVLLGGAPREEALAAWAAFLRDEDVLLTWGSYAPRWLVREGLRRADAPAFDLRRLAADAWRRSPGSLEGCVERLGLLAPPLGAGRGGRRLGRMFALWRALPGGPHATAGASASGPPPPA